MLPQKTRSIFACLLALALVAGLVAHDIGASGMAGKMTVAAASDTPMSNDCGICGNGDEKMSLAACSAYCSGMTAQTVAIVVAEVLYGDGPEIAVPMPAVVGTNDPPDPYPPRFAVLS